jgi:hypothetical protein
MTGAANLQRLEAALRSSQALDRADAALLLDGLAAGSLDRALGLRPSPGERSAAARSAQADRDALIRNMAAEYFSGMPASTCAEMIAGRLGRYRGGGDWRADRSKDAISYLNSVRGRCWQILKKVDRDLSVRRIREILATEK